MKATDFAALLQRYAESGMAAGDPARLNRLSRIFALAGSRTVAAVLKGVAASRAGFPAALNDGTARALKQLATLVAPIAKAGVAKDIAAVADVVARLGLDEAITALGSPARPAKSRSTAAVADPEVVDRAVAELTAALGKPDVFGAAYQHVIDTANTKEIVAIARAFSPGSVKSAAEAKRRILARQQALAGVAAKSRATSGRSAA